MRKILHSLLFACILLLAQPQDAQNLSDQIPDLGQPENRFFSAKLQGLYGRLIYSEFYQSAIFEHDRIINDYINHLGFQLFAQVHDSRHIPRFFVINQNTINAFAYPGGTIGFHSKLITETETESELAGVMAHELSHVSQNHIARSVQNSAQQAPLQLLATLAAVLAAANSDSANAAAGSLAVTQGLFAQQSINFTRSQEAEADRVAIQLLEKSDFDASGFRDFFTRLQKNYSDDRAFKVPEILRSHPLPRSRIADTSARLTETNTEPHTNTLSYEIVRALLWEKLPYEQQPNIELINYSEHGKAFHHAIRHIRSNPKKAIKLLEELNKQSFNVYIPYKLAQLQFQAGYAKQAMNTIENALGLFPDNSMLSLFKAELLIDRNKLDSANELLIDLQEKRSHPDIYNLRAKIYQKKNSNSKAYTQLAEYSYAIGDYYQALFQLDTARSYKSINKEEKSLITQRYEEIYHELPDDLRKDLIRNNRRR